LISVILYGRNDSYGYNLHKRAALSLNCIAALLDGPDDEILFVDYNTPDDFPSFPEAIADTLTARARQLLRVLRVRPAQHRRFAGLSHLVALEPVARNVALRRANPANRWVLSTNTDMIFVPHAATSLTAIVAGLPDGYFHLPRMELPESLWESLDRGDAAGTIARVGDWWRRFHLNEIVTLPLPSIPFDGPGDFQLMLREDLVRIHGFDERMLLGWHVDANIARRVSLLCGPSGDLVDALFGYHCDHTRQVTPAHRPDSVENDMERFVHAVAEPGLPGQAETWGLAGEAVEEIRLDGSAVSYVEALAGAIGPAMTAPTTVALAMERFDRIGYDAPRVLPFLLDTLSSYPRTTRLGWFAGRRDLLALFAKAWRALGFAHPVRVAAGADWLGPALPEGAEWAGAAEIGAEADVFVFDFGLPPGCDSSADGPAGLAPELRAVAAGLRAMVRAERLRMAAPDRAPRRFIAVNAIHNRFDQLMREHVGAARSPLATRIRQGMLLPLSPQAPPLRELDLLARLAIGEAGRREPGGIRPLPGRRGHVFYGPYLDLPPGRWRFELQFEPDRGLPHPGPVKLVAQSRAGVLAGRVVLLSGLVAHRIVLDITVPDDGSDDGPEDWPGAPPLLLEFVLSSIGWLRGRFTVARLRMMDGEPG